MVDAKISELPADASVTGSEQVPVNDGGTTKRVTTQQIADLASSAASESGNSTGFVVSQGSGTITENPSSIARWVRVGDLVLVRAMFIAGVASAGEVGQYVTLTLPAAVPDFQETDGQGPNLLGWGYGTLQSGLMELVYIPFGDGSQTIGLYAASDHNNYGLAGAADQIVAGTEFQMSLTYRAAS